MYHMADTAQGSAAKETYSLDSRPIIMHLTEAFGFILCVQRKCCKST